MQINDLNSCNLQQIKKYEMFLKNVTDNVLTMVTLTQVLNDVNNKQQNNCIFFKMNKQMLCSWGRFSFDTMKYI